VKLELITRVPEKANCRTPVLFVHGGWHGAWCWDEHFLGYFAERGFTVFALSFRNHGKSQSMGSIRWKRGSDYVADLREIVQEIGQPPVLVGHSMGGYVVQRYLERWKVPAAVLLASLPPHGMAPAFLRGFRRHPWATAKVLLQMRTWPAVATTQLARDALFSKEMLSDQVEAYFSKLQDESLLVFLDMLFLRRPRPRRVKRVQQVPMLVLDCSGDAQFTSAEVRSTARAYNAESYIFAGMAHDMMLEPGWEGVASRIIDWLRGPPGLC
jgi:pimeloyl-ACP methyl ester carboxylesterase